MRRTSHLLQKVTNRIGIAVVLCVMVLIPQIVQADLAVTPSLVISQLKITSSNGQFVTLFNSTNAPLDLSKYQLEYFNSYDLSKATSSRLVSLQGILPPHSYYQVNDSALVLCYRLIIDSQSLSFSSTAGYVGVVSLSQSNSGGALTPQLHDYVSWSKTPVNGVQTLPTSANGFLQRQPADTIGNPMIKSPGIGTWLPVQPDASNACNIVSFTAQPQSVATGLTQLLPSVEPAASFVTAPADSDGVATPSAVLPAADIGLKAPTITEILPNPEGSSNDSTEEYIELHNPNDKPFDLTGFIMQTGLTSSRSHAFAAGTMLAPNSFTALKPDVTGVSLSNTAGLARLLDPFGNTINVTGQYGTAKDGHAWALAKGKWYFTTQPTPGAANVIKLPPATTKKKSAAKNKIPKTVVKKLNVAGNGKAQSSSGFQEDEPQTTPVHVWVLALVAVAAVLYGAYEYRSDISQRISKLRRNPRVGAPDRLASEGRGSN